MSKRTLKIDVEEDEELEVGNLFQAFTVTDDDKVLSVDIYISDNIGDDTHAYTMLYVKLNSIQKGIDVNIYLACDGGNVASAQRICHTIRRCKGNTTIYVDAPCASAGSLIALSGDKLVLAKDANLMFHGAAGGLSGNISVARKTMDVTHKWCKANDIEFATPFLTMAEIDLINDTAEELHIYGDDKDINKRIKRHFK